MMNRWPFHSLLGQEYAASVLSNALDSDRLAGAYLFVGPDGVGKTTAARQFAKALCGALSEDDLRSQAIDSGASPDVREVGPQGASQVISIAQLWPRDGHKEFRPENAMLRDLSFEPMAGNKRVFIIRDAEGLNDSSGNSLLKTLEEPPRYSHFILSASSPSAVLPTILSRSVVIRFGTVAPSIIEQALIERCSLPPAHARFLALYSEGRPGRALALAKSPALLAGRDALLDLARDLATADQVKCFRLAEEFRKAAPKLKTRDIDTQGENTDGEEKASRASILRGLDLLSSYYRDLLAISLQGEERAHPVNSDRFVELAAAARRHKPDRLEEGLAFLTAMRRAIERNGSIQLAVDQVFLRLAALRA